MERRFPEKMMMPPWTQEFRHITQEIEVIALDIPRELAHRFGIREGGWVDEDKIVATNATALRLARILFRTYPRAHVFLDETIRRPRKAIAHHIALRPIEIRLGKVDRTHALRSPSCGIHARASRVREEVEHVLALRLRGNETARYAVIEEQSHIEIACQIELEGKPRFLREHRLRKRSTARILPATLRLLAHARKHLIARYLEHGCSNAPPHLRSDDMPYADRSILALDTPR